jgi:hypothetical protein
LRPYVGIVCPVVVESSGLVRFWQSGGTGRVSRNSWRRVWYCVLHWLLGWTVGLQVRLLGNGRCIGTGHCVVGADVLRLLCWLEWNESILEDWDFRLDCCGDQEWVQEVGLIENFLGLHELCDALLCCCKARELVQTCLEEA